MIFMSVIVCGYFLTELKADAEKIQLVISLVLFGAFVVI